MYMFIGPFNIIFFASIALIIYTAGFYYVFKSTLGIPGFLTILLFPLVGSLGVILYSLKRKVTAAKKIG